LAESGVSICFLRFGLDAKQRALLDQLLNKFRDELPNTKLNVSCCPSSNIQYLADFDNKMTSISMCLKQASEIPILMKMLALPRPDGQQRVIDISSEGVLILEFIKTIKEVKLSKNFAS
jgi:hypothetical protein